jgi:glycosyltransferase involved in cell wall biosynthesis
VSINRKRLAVLTTHPIQYHGSWFRKLASQPELNVEVFYCHKATPKEQAEAGFGVEFDWDVSLLEGYPYRFLQNVSRRPGIARFGGLDTPEVKDIITREQFDAVIINGWHYKSAWQAMRACWRTRTPVMVRSDSHLNTERSTEKRITKWPLYRWFIPKLDACLAVGSWSRDYFLHYGARPERIFTVPHMVDSDYFARESTRLLPRRVELRQNWGLDKDATVFLFAGKFIEKKRPMDFLKAISHAAKRGAQVSGLMVGDGPLRRACEEKVRSESLPIAFTGFLNQSKIVTAYITADALVLPSDGGETWGLVVNEAMACGLPCFVSDHVGCSPDLITSNETGAVFPLGNSEALGMLLSDFAGDKSKQAEMRRRVARGTDKYSGAAALAGTLEALNSIHGLNRIR